MKRENWYWDLNMPFEKIRQILACEDDPRFPRVAETLLSRVQDPKQVFELITPVAFCRRFRAIAKKIESDEWTKERAAFWKVTYLRLLKELQDKGEKIRKVDVIELDAFDRVLVEKVIQCRKAVAMSQKELARFMGCSQQFISGIETGREKISMDFLKKLSQVTQKNIFQMYDAQNETRNENVPNPILSEGGQSQIKTISPPMDIPFPFGRPANLGRE